jgi:hypothetical protein
MTFLLAAGGILAGIVILLLAAALFIPRHYSVSVSVLINRPQQVVYDFVKILQNQPRFSEWLKADPQLKPAIVGTDGAVGAVQKWESSNKDVGAGEQEIKVMTENFIEVELRLIKPMAATCRITNDFTANGHQQTRYTCTFYAYAKYPINLPSFLVGRRFIIKAQQRSLNNLKGILEAVAYQA